MSRRMLTIIYDASKMSDSEIESLIQKLHLIEPTPTKWKVVNLETLDSEVAGIMKRRQTENN